MSDFPALPIRIVEGAGVTEDAETVILMLEAEPGPLSLAIPVDQIPQLLTVLAKALEHADSVRSKTN